MGLFQKLFGSWSNAPEPGPVFEESEMKKVKEPEELEEPIEEITLEEILPSSMIPAEVSDKPLLLDEEAGVHIQSTPDEVKFALDKKIFLAEQADALVREFNLTERFPQHSRMKLLQWIGKVSQLAGCGPKKFTTHGYWVFGIAICQLLQEEGHDKTLMEEATKIVDPDGCLAASGDISSFEFQRLLAVSKGVGAGLTGFNSVKEEETFLQRA